jgi:hypothetical protein
MPNKTELLKVYADLLKTAKGHNKVAYSFATTLLENLADNVEIDIRGTKNGAYNIGDLGECLVRNAINPTDYQTWARQGRNDLARKNLNEIKTFAAANRNPNGLAKPSGFIAVSEYGIHHITKEMIEKRWEILKDNKGLKEISKAILKEIIENENPKVLKNLNKKILG